MAWYDEAIFYGFYNIYSKFLPFFHFFPADKTVDVIKKKRNKTNNNRNVAYIIKTRNCP